MGRGGGWHLSLAYIRRGGGAFFYTQFDLRQVSQISLLSLSPSSSGLPLFGVYTWLRFLRHTHAVVLLESESESIFFPLLFWFGARRERRVHRMRVIPRGATLVVLLHRRGRIATSSPTTFRRGRNPVIGLRGPGGLRIHRGSHLPLGVTNEGREAIIISRTSRKFLVPLSGTPIVKIGEL